MSAPSRLIASARQVQWARAGPSNWRHASSATATATQPSPQAHVQTPPPPRSAARAKKIRSAPQTTLNEPRKRLDRSDSTSRSLRGKNSDAIKSFRIALTALDVDEAWTGWQKIRDSGQIYVVGPEEFSKLIQLIESSKDEGDRLVVLSDDLCRTKKWDPLSECLLALLKKGQSEAIMDLASKILSNWEEIRYRLGSLRPTHPVVEVAVTLAATVCAKRAEPDITPLTRLVRPLSMPFMNKAGSYGKTKDDAQQSNGSGLTIQGAIGVLKRILPDAASARLPFTFCRHVILAWGLETTLATDLQKRKYNPGILANRIYLLCNSNEVEAAEMLLDTALEARQVEYGSWLKMTTQNDPTAEWNDRTWHALLGRTIAKGETVLAAKVWDAYASLKPADASPTPAIWNALLTGYAESKQWESVQATWDHMIATRRPTDTIDMFPYNTVMTALFESWKPSEALLIFEDIKHLVATGRLEWDSTPFTTVISGLSLNRRTEEAVVIFQDMVAGRHNYPKPSISTINVFLRDYARLGQVDKIVDMLETMSELGVEPDNYTFNTVMGAFVTAGRKGAVDDVLGAMRQAGIVTDDVTLTTLITSHLSDADGTPVDFDAALAVLLKMEFEGPTPSTVTYTAVINALCTYDSAFESLCKRRQLRVHYDNVLKRYMARSRESLVGTSMPTMSRSLSFAFALVDRMRERGLKPDRTLYHTLIAGLFRQQATQAALGDTAASLGYLERAKIIFNECLKSPGPNAKTWVLMLESLMGQVTIRDQEVAKEIRRYLIDIIAQINSSEQHRTLSRVVYAMRQAAEVLKTA